MRTIFLVAFLVLTGCAHTPTTQIVEVPVSVPIKHVDLPSCPVLPILALTADSTWDARLPAWQASLMILQGCYDADRKILQEVFK